MPHWYELALFDGFELGYSYITAWRCEGEDLVFSLDAFLTPDHPDHTQPAPDEWGCYRTAELRFLGVSDVRNLPSMETAPFAVDASGERDFGNVDALAHEAGRWSLCGDFGEVIVACKEVSLELAA